jgi:sn-1 stearoyl-lipid 9-desaturase
VIAGIVAATAAWLVAGTALGLGNTVGYHRLLTHRSFEVPVWVRGGLVLLGALHSGPPLGWVALHRLHHARSDGPGDPHSPRDGLWHAHCGWMIGARHPAVCLIFALSGFGQQAVLLVNDVRRLARGGPAPWLAGAPDLAPDPWLRLLDAPLVLPALFLGQVAFAVGLFGWPGLVWLWALHTALTNGSWAVNSVGHAGGVGRAPFDNRDTSRNVGWLAALTFGEGWHNHHHRFPRSAWHGLDAGPDPSWWAIVSLARLGLAREIWLPRAWRGRVPPAWLSSRGPRAG